MADIARLARELCGEYIPMTSCATNALRLRHQAFSNAWKQWRSQRGDMTQTVGECFVLQLV